MILKEDFLFEFYKSTATGSVCFSPYVHDINRRFPFELMWIGYNFCLSSRLLGNVLVGGCIFVDRSKFWEIGGFDENVNTHENAKLSRCFSRKELGVINSDAYFCSRRFVRDGFWKVFWMYGTVFIRTLFGGKYNSDSNMNYFDATFK
jgi:hypothetical protein